MLPVEWEACGYLEQKWSSYIIENASALLLDLVLGPRDA